MKPLFLLFLFLVLCSVSVLGSCVVGEDCVISVWTTNVSNTTQLLNATSCNVTILNESFSVLVNGVGMNHPVLGLYNYSFVSNVSGHFFSYVTCSGVDVSLFEDESFIVEQNSGYWMLAILLPILGVIGVFAYFSIRMDKIHYFIKVLLFLASISLSIVSVNIGRLLVEEYSSASTDLISLLNVASFVLIIFLIVVTAYLIIYYIAELLWGIAKSNFGKTP
jgi:sensor histidine kinase YesM